MFSIIVKHDSFTKQIRCQSIEGDRFRFERGAQLLLQRSAYFVPFAKVRRKARTGTHWNLFSKFTDPPECPWLC